MALPQSHSELRAAIHAQKRGVVAVAVFSFCINLLLLTSPLYMMQVYDRVLSSRSLETLFFLSLIALFFFGILSLLETLRSFVLARIGNRIEMALADRIFDANYARHLSQSTGSRVQPMSDLNQIRRFLTGNGLIGFLDAPWTLIFAIMLLMFHWTYGLLALFGGAALALLAFLSERLTRETVATTGKAAAAGNKFADSALQNVEAIESMGMLPAIRGRWRALHDRMLGYQSLASDRTARFSAISRFVRISVQSLSLGVGAWLVIDRAMSPALMFAANILIGRVMLPIEQIIKDWRTVIESRAAWRRLDTLLTTYPAGQARLELPAPLGNVSVEAVSVVSPETQAVLLRNLNFQVGRGETIGIIGPSAAGKSTLARVLAGVWPPRAGKVRLDEADLAVWDKSRLGPHIGYLPQGMDLFAGTVADNICRFGDADNAAILAAANLAHVHEMICRLPNGYETDIGEHGHLLSAGQRQRLGLARALYGDPKLVILDEPNANLDDAGEQALMQALAALKARNVTIFLVAHRPAILATADRILVLRDGQIAAFGARADILAKVTPAANVVTLTR